MLKKLTSKTRLAALAIAIVGVLQSQGIVKVTPDQVEMILTLLGGVGLWGLRDAIDKVG